MRLVTVRPRSLAVYVLPSRIQQGLGDGLELGRAVAQTAARGHRLLFVPSVAQPSSSRRDGRVVPLDPRELIPSGFPRVTRCDEPIGEGPAVIVATWWGIAARTTDDAGGAVPGPWAATAEAIARRHSSRGVLIVSLEESATARSAETALAEGLRQAGWSRTAIRNRLASSKGRRDVAAYARAFRDSRGAARADVLHLVPVFRPSPPAARAFPFLLQVGPFWPHARPQAPRRPRKVGRPARVVWYASPSSSPFFAPTMDRALATLRQPARVTVRTHVPFPLPAARSAGRGSPRQWLEAPRLDRTRWQRLWRSADLLIATGTQTVVEALEERRPFVYFNGRLSMTGQTSRGFRREKVLSLAAAIRARDPRGARDLLSFADGRRVGPVLRAALFDPAWRNRSAHWVDHVRAGFPGPLVDGGGYVASLLDQFARFGGPVTDFVGQVRRHHASLM